MLKLSQLYLQFTLVAFRALRKDIQNETGAISHTAFKQPFQVALLGRIEIVIKDGDGIRLIRLDAGSELFSLARAEKIAGIRLGAAAFNRIADLNACTCYELPELLQALPRIRPAKIKADQYCCVPASGPVLHYLLLSLLVTWVVGRDSHGAPWYMVEMACL